MVARSIEHEIDEGRGFEGGCVHLDIRHIGADLINERLPGIRQIAIDFAGVDPISEPIPIQPGQHYSMGGIDVGIDGQSSLPGLYAAGECACVSVHGANRLGGNSLLETVVFGRLVGESIAREVPSVARPSHGPVEEAVRETDGKIALLLENKGRTSLFPLLDSLKETMWTKFGIFRTEAAMQEGLAEIRNLKEQFRTVSLTDTSRDANPVLIRYLELEYMLPVAETVALGALGRKEKPGFAYPARFPGPGRRPFPEAYPRPRNWWRYFYHVRSGHDRDVRARGACVLMKPITLKVARSRAGGERRYDTFTIDPVPGMTVLSALFEVQARYDNAPAFRYSAGARPAAPVRC